MKKEEKEQNLLLLSQIKKEIKSKEELMMLLTLVKMREEIKKVNKISDFELAS